MAAPRKIRIRSDDMHAVHGVVVTDQDDNLVAGVRAITWHADVRDGVPYARIELAAPAVDLETVVREAVVADMRTGETYDVQLAAQALEDLVRAVAVRMTGSRCIRRPEYKHEPDPGDCGQCVVCLERLRLIGYYQAVGAPEISVNLLGKDGWPIGPRHPLAPDATPAVR